jgi:hypothetical protein
VQAARKAFARTLRRQHKLGLAGSVTAPEIAEALLRIERQPPPAPRDARRRAIARAWAVLALPDRPAPPPKPAPSLVAAKIMGAAAALVLLAAVGLLWQPRERAKPPATHPAALAMTPPPRPFLAPPPTAPPPAPLRVSEEPSRVGLIGHWRAEDGGGLGSRDLSSSRNDCLVRSLGPEAVDFDGRRWLECPHVDRLAALEDEISVAAWIRPRELLRSRTIVARQEGHGRGDDLFFGVVNGTLMASSQTWKARVAHQLPASRGWMHVAFTRSAQGTLRLFADGALLAQSSGPPARIGGGTSVLTIGASLNGPDRAIADEGFIGEIDEVLIYDRALPAGELEALASHRH